MNVADIVLYSHIVLGAAGLILGPVAMRAAKRPGLHTRAGTAYHWVVLGICLTAAVLSVLDWARIWWFLPIAVGSYLFALLGYTAATRRWDGWLRFHITGQGGSYIALVTALLVVNWEDIPVLGEFGSNLAWVLPTVIGTAFLVWLQREVSAGRRPRNPT